MGKLGWRILGGVGLLLIAGAAAAGVWGWRQWQSTPVYQFRAARDLWAARTFRHYRLSANYSTNWAQCHYDIEVRDDNIERVHGITCLSAEGAHTLTVDGIFRNFERYTTQRVCAANGCYCDGTYVLRATYDPVLGHPWRITTRFVRNWLDDLLAGQYRQMSCVRADPTVERIEIVSVQPLP